MKKSSAKEGVKRLANILGDLGITHYVISPGSRNAPLIKTFTQNPQNKCYSVVDERSAGYFALGMAIREQSPVGLVCTSGTAVLNYAPALAEAYYQKIPLIAITADRPEELIDQREGQAIQQRDVFHNYVKGFAQLPQEPYDEDRLWHGDRMISETVNKALMAPRGPVHLNVPLREPLYESSDTHNTQHKTIRLASTVSNLDKSEYQALAQRWNKASRIMILTGSLHPSGKLDRQLAKLAEFPAITVLTERTSNIFTGNYHHHIDRLLNTMPENREPYAPDLLITIGNDVVSKQIKAFLRKYRPREHWHIEETSRHTDTYKSLTRLIPLEAVTFLESLIPLLKKQPSDYGKLWNDLEQCARKVHLSYIEKAPWSDLKAFATLSENIPSHSVVHLGNSSPVRYALLFPPRQNTEYHANRGTSGIDGIISTAAGFAFADNRINTVISGDLSFFYDSNALWNKQMPANLRIIVINNQGGSIFRIIPGPDTTDVLEDFFETKQELNIRAMAEVYGLYYYNANEQSHLQDVLKKIYQPHDKAVILEIKTPGDENDTVLKNYFKTLKSE